VQTCVVNDPSAGRNQFPRHLFGKSPFHRHGVPGTLADELLHGLDVAVGKPSRHEFDGLTCSVRKKPRYLSTAPSTTPSFSQGFQKILEKRFEATTTLKQFFLVHDPIGENPW
jgi:hypothetical protein